MRNQSLALDSMWIFVPLAIFMYVIPWVLNGTFVLSIGAYDIAELLTKRPFDDTTYYTTLTLRGQLVFMAWLIAFGVNRPLFTLRWWIHGIFALVLVVAQLPPLTFITNAGDANQQQQALLAVISLVGVIIGMTGIVWKYRYPVRVVIALAGIATTVYAVINALDIIDDYGLPANIGMGAIGLVIVYVILGIATLFQWQAE